MSLYIIIDPMTTYIGDDVAIGEGTVIHPNTVIAAGTRIGRGCVIGPMAHVREGCRIGDNCVVGTFVQLKNTCLGNGTVVTHHAYLGDCDVGENVNVGCMVVTANYDGKAKHKTVIGDGAFLGCHTTLVAPVTVGAGAWTAAGSVITEDVPDGALGIARSRQTLKDGWAEGRR